MYIVYILCCEILICTRSVFVNIYWRKDWNYKFLLEIMSIKVENNLINTEKKELFEQRAHFIPCSIEEDGPAKVKQYFETYIEDNAGELKGTFRGRPLEGTKMTLPEGYVAITVDETRRPLSEDAERKFQVTNGFKEIVYWNWDKKPSKNDNLIKAMDWIDISEAIHGP